MIDDSMCDVASCDSILAPGAKPFNQKITQNRERNCVSTIGAPGVPTKRFVRREPQRLTSHKRSTAYFLQQLYAPCTINPTYVDLL